MAVPAFQGPDEEHHFAYVQYLAETGHLPSPTTGGTSLSSEVYAALTTLNLQSLIGNLSGKPGWSRADLSLWRQTDRALGPGSAANGAGPNPIAKNPPLYYAVMAVPYSIFRWLPLLKRVFVMRLVNGLMYLATIALMWLLVAEVFGRVRLLQVIGTGAVALEPQLAFTSAVINADTLLVTLTTGFLLAALRLVRRGPSLRRVLVASVLAAAACLTHGRGLVTLPVLAVALVSACIAHRVPLREAILRASGAAGVLGFAAAAYSLFGQPSSGSAFGGQVTALNSGRFNLRQFITFVYQFYFGRLPSLRPRLGPEFGYRQVFIDTFYATFGSLEVTFRQRVYDVLQVLSALGLLGLYTVCVIQRKRLKRAWPTVLVIASLALTTIVFLHYVSYRALVSNGGSDPLIVGRYLLPLISLFGLAITFTVRSLPRRAAPYAGALILAIGALLSLTGLGITAARFYA
ncbi:MAG: hypothetical protein ACYDA6_07130 [Solirubrobacteraceae bacterium]